jgi:hypothetical protein
VTTVTGVGSQTSSIGLRVWIPGGTFHMGSDAHDPEEERHGCH